MNTPTPEERRQFAEAHAEGLHDEAPREFCPECEALTPQERERRWGSGAREMAMTWPRFLEDEDLEEAFQEAKTAEEIGDVSDSLPADLAALEEERNRRRAIRGEDPQDG